MDKIKAVVEARLLILFDLAQETDGKDENEVNYVMGRFHEVGEIARQLDIDVWKYISERGKVDAG